MYDRTCQSCGRQQIDLYEPINAAVPTCACGGRLERVWLNHASSIIGDECDVTIKHGLCWPDGTPRRFTSRAEMRREAEKRGLVNHVEHIPSPGSDRSKHTVRWI
jgi:hypothetical protein